MARFEIPLPPIDVQREIVEEIEGYQKVIDGNRELVARLEDKIRAAVGRAWPD